MARDTKILEDLERENEELRGRLEVAEETLEAIRRGRVDAVVVEGPKGTRIYTLTGADRPYRVMIEEMQEGALALGQEDVVLYCNRQIARMLRTTHEALLGASLLDYLPPASRPEFEALVHRRSSGSRRGEVVFQGADGTLVPTYVAVNLLHLEEMTLLSLVLTDLTEHKQHESLLASQALSDAVLDQTSDAILVCDQSGQVLQASQAAHRLCGANPLLRPCSEVLPLRYAESSVGGQRRPNRAGAVVPLPSTLPQEPIHRAEVLLRKPDGGCYDLLLSVSPFVATLPETAGFVVTLTDITELKRAQDDLRRLTDELEQRVAQRTAELATANRELEAFGYSVSHDLRAPLRHITGFVEAMEEHVGPELDDEGRRYLRIIAESAERMGTLIDDLLDFSRIGRVPMVERAVDLGQLVDQARGELAAETKSRTVAWQVEPLPTVHGDPTLLRSVITNLLSNALKFTRRKDPARIEIACQLQGDEWICRVRDNGAGFDMRHVHKLFGVFQRLHPASEFEGTGIGLASVRRVIQRHGGRVWAEGVVDRGATFYFSLPAKEVAHDPETNPAGRGRSQRCGTDTARPEEA